MKKIFNSEMIVSVEVHDKKESNGIEWYPAKTNFFGRKVQQEGFYSNSYDKDGWPIWRRYEESDLMVGLGPNGFKYIVENKKCYFRPYVTINYVDQSKANFYFSTFELANQFASLTIEQFKDPLIVNINS